MVTGIDDHSRYVVIAQVLAVPNGRSVCAAFVAAMDRYGVPGTGLGRLSSLCSAFQAPHLRCLAARGAVCGIDRSSRRPVKLDPAMSDPQLTECRERAQPPGEPKTARRMHS